MVLGIGAYYCEYWKHQHADASPMLPALERVVSGADTDEGVAELERFLLTAPL
jgi:hypothetical protein